MSDYEVSLVNDNMQEFFVRFYGPKESMSTAAIPSIPYTLPSVSRVIAADVLIISFVVCAV